MFNRNNNNNDIINNIRNLIENRQYREAEDLIAHLMEVEPHSAKPHNLMGILLEHTNKHSVAMNHFRAAWALDSTYLPARYNLDKYGSFDENRSNHDFYTIEDCKKAKNDKNTIVEYDNKGIGHIVNTVEVKYDENGIGHIVRR